MKLKLIAASLLLGAALSTPAGPALAQAGSGPTPTPTATPVGSPVAGATAVTVGIGATPSTAITPISQTAPNGGSPVAQPPATRPPGATAAPIPTVRAGAPGATTPRAGGLPTALALPLLAGGAAALGGGIYLLRRGRRP